MTRVWERLFIGGASDGESLATSNPDGIATVVCLCLLDLPSRRRGVNYPQFYLLPAGPVPRGELDAIIDVIWENIRWGKVMICSFAGSGRAPVLAAAWMHCAGYCSFDRALGEISKLRPIEANSKLLESVKEAL